MLELSNKPGIYVHIPFCVQKCKYCAFLSSHAPDAVKEFYVEALIKEIHQKVKLCNLKWFDTVYFGGGTPTSLNADQIERILKAINESFHIVEDAEYTIEANPGTLSEDFLQRLHDMGFNRLSMGVQSMNDERLKFIGRIHSAEDVRRDFELARKAGFENINLDIIFSIPGETTEDALADIKQIAELGPEHISFYSLQLEEGTELYKMWERREVEEVPDKIDRETYHKGTELLESLGYEKYEISNFCKKEYESRHNSKYWNMSEYLGLGLGASGMIQPMDCGKNWRYSNITDLAEYCETLEMGKSPEADSHFNDEHDNVSEAVFTGLRRKEGIKYKDIFVGGESAFWDYYKDEREEFLEFVENGYALADSEGIKLTEVGIDISNRIMAIFV